MAKIRAIDIHVDQAAARPIRRANNRWAGRAYRQASVVLFAALMTSCVAEPAAQPEPAPSPAPVPAPEPQPPAEPAVPLPQLRDIDLNLYMYPGHWSLIEGSADKCEGTVRRWGYHVGKTVALVGPDGNHLAAANVPEGRVGVLADNPETDLCLFEFTFADVPEVATYRIQEPDGNLAILTWSLNQIRSDGWAMFMHYGNS